ncbi:hypothetical protein B0O99DRAFT_748021 [Bisporella sp. PMI_857]|nr:hypothetical protein B0O99DRAFT_748021 [Bisporella sp. PMI_857]
MAAAAFEYSFVYKTDPNPYHLLLVQSQLMINQAFHNMWAIADDDSPIHKFDVKVDGVGNAKGDLDAPAVELHVTSAKPQLYFKLLLISGTLTLYTNEDISKDASTKTWDMAGWIFTFPVNIASKTLTSSDTEYKGYVQKMGNPSGQFSLAQLYIDVSQSTTWDPQRSSFKTEDWSTETSTVQKNFQKFVQSWLKQMATGKKTIVGVSLKTSDPASVNKNAPTFPPTSFDYAMYPWIDPEDPQGATDSNDANALSFVLMTDKTTPPSPPRLPNSGTFVNATSNNKGALCMNSDQFWGNYLLILLQRLNRAAEIYPLKPSVYADTFGKVVVVPNGLIGYNPDHQDPTDKYFKFMKDDKPTKWRWLGDRLKASAEDNAGPGAWLNHIECHQSAQSGSWVCADVGGQGIHIAGQSKLRIEVKKTGSAGGGSKEATCEITTDWHVNFALGVVSDGGLQITRIKDENAEVTVKSTNTNSGFENFDELASSVKGQIQKNLDNNIGYVVNHLIDDFAHEHQLFLPASGTFLVANAKFNNRGDLMAALSYNGATPPGEKAKKPEYLSRLPDRMARLPKMPERIVQEPWKAPKITIPELTIPEVLHEPVTVTPPPMYGEQ